MGVGGGGGWVVGLAAYLCCGSTHLMLGQFKINSSQRATGMLSLYHKINQYLNSFFLFTNCSQHLCSSRSCGERPEVQGLGVHQLHVQTLRGPHPAGASACTTQELGRFTFNDFMQELGNFKDFSCSFKN